MTRHDLALAVVAGATAGLIALGARVLPDHGPQSADALTSARAASASTGQRATPGHLRGTFTILRFDGDADDPCELPAGFTDIGDNALVVLTDEHGTRLATGTLGDEVRVGTDCRYEFDLGNVPQANMYRVEVGHRGAVAFSSAQLRRDGGVLALQVGVTMSDVDHDR